MPDSTQQLPKALVLRWDGRTLRVKCPYCLSSHGHAFPAQWTEAGNPNQRPRVHTHRRRSDCHDVAGGDYILAFPGSGDLSVSGYGWELDRASSTFMATDHNGVVPVPVEDDGDGRTVLAQYQSEDQVDMAEDDDSEDNELASAVGNLDIGDEAGEENRGQQPPPTPEEITEELYADPQYRKIVYISSCVRRNIPALKSLLQKYPDDGFIGSVDEDGSTGSLLAAMEENGLETLRWLQRHGDPIDRADKYGRTPLMGAALWGRLETVQYLTEQSVRLNAVDGNGMTALGLAADTQRNANERKARAGKVYREPGDASTKREQIVALLNRLTPSVSRLPVATAPPQRAAFFSRRPDGNLEIYRPQELLQIPGTATWKAFATLDRGPNYPFVNAMSGYTHPGWPNVLHNNVWTDKADDLREALDLPRDRSSASHVEPQLLAYLLDRHSLQLFEQQDDGEGDEGADVLEPDLEDVWSLSNAMPAYDMEPIITVSKRSLCDKCKEFVQRFETVFPSFGVQFETVGDRVYGET